MTTIRIPAGNQHLECALDTTFSSVTVETAMCEATGENVTVSFQADVVDADAYLTWLRTALLALRPGTSWTHFQVVADERDTWMAHSTFRQGGREVEQVVVQVMLGRGLAGIVWTGAKATLPNGQARALAIVRTLSLS